jgi:hypothetical protein
MEAWILPILAVVLFAAIPQLLSDWLERHNRKK